jgi:hypothetical protein
LDLHNGHVIARVEESHRSVEFIGLLTDLYIHYPAGCIILIILDNHNIRVRSPDELRQRILKGIDEINQMPVGHRWKAFNALATQTDTV